MINIYSIKKLKSIETSIDHVKYVFFCLKRGFLSDEADHFRMIGVPCPSSPSLLLLGYHEPMTIRSFAFMDVSKTRSTPKWMVYYGKPY